MHLNSLLETSTRARLLNRLNRLCVASLIFCAALHAQTQGPQVQWVVATDGADSNPGTVDAPFRTLEAARNAIRAAKTPEGSHVLLREGTYTRSKCFALTAQDSGTAEAPIVYTSWPGESATLLAGKAVPADQWTPLSPHAAVRVHPRVDPKRLVELDYDALGIANGDVLNPRTQSASAPSSFVLFANGERQPLSRWPNAMENVTGRNDPGWATPNGTRDNHSFYFGKGGQPRDKDTTNELDFDGTKRSARWKKRIDAGHSLWLRGHWRTPWAPRLSLVAGMNLKEQWIKLSDVPPGGMGSKYTRPFKAHDGKSYRTGDGGERFYALNLIEEIDQPGEYAIDFKDRRVYYYPAGDVTSQRIVIMDNPVDHVSLNGVSGVTFSNLTFHGGLRNGLTAKKCQHINITGCTFHSIGHTPIAISGGSHYLVHGNDLLKAGSAGLSVHNVGNRTSLTSSHTIIANNHIGHPCQRRIGSPGLDLSGVGIIIRNNLIHHTSSAGIRHTGNNNLFEYNEIHNCALQTSDTGATYTTQRWESYGNIFRYNFIHHNRRANGFYCDDGDSGDFHYKNILHNCIDALKFGGGHDNLAENNLLIKNEYQRIDSRGTSRNYRIGTRYESRLRAVKPMEEPWRSFGTQMQKEHHLTTTLWSDVLDENWKPEHPNGSRYKDNVTVESSNWSIPKGKSGALVVMEGNEEVGSVEAAGFRNFEKLDLHTMNATILAKFPELNTALPKMGLQIDDVRSDVPSRGDVGGLENFGSGFTDGEDENVAKPGKKS